jgi:hypothetical protein
VLKGFLTEPEKIYINGLGPWKVPKWPWFGADEAVEALKDLATLITLCKVFLKLPDRKRTMAKKLAEKVEAELKAVLSIEDIRAELAFLRYIDQRPEFYSEPLIKRAIYR